jgi:beta-lactamase superfamily II metal-dependent hydrolase
MPKRKPPSAPKMWSHLVNGRDWEIYLTNGQTLRPVEEIEVSAARELAKTSQVILISYGSSAADLTGDRSAIADALA